MREALEYWSAAIGIPYDLLVTDAPPRILVRSGTDGLGGSALGRGLIDGADEGNWATSGLIVIRPGTLGRVYRHEFGHALGFLGHSPAGLMSNTFPANELSDRERRMMVALYSLPAGTRVQADGTWVAPGGGSGRLDDHQAASDIVEFNMGAAGGASFRRTDRTCRWPLPVRVFVQR
jgi:hypothetical protein